MGDGGAWGGAGGGLVEEDVGGGGGGAKYTFEPEINNVSKAMAMDMKFSVEQLNENARGKAAREKAAREAQEKFRAECTFKPKIPKRPTIAAASGEGKSEKFQLNLSNPEDLTLQVTRYNESREATRQQKIREREMQELKECTFKPTTNHSRTRSRPAAAKNNDENASGGGGGGGYLASHKAKRSSASGKRPVVVRGLGRHLELRALAERKTKEAAAREAKAFSVKGLSDRAKYPDGTTQVREFRLSKAKDGRTERARREREEMLRKECTFQPQTVERRNREVLRAVLGSDDGSSVM